MADVELVIKIDEKLYKDIYSDAEIMIYWGMRSGKTLLATLLRAIRKGTPLPKRHGRMGDLDKIKKEMQNYHDDCAKTSEYTRLGFETAIAVVEDADAIIEADKEGE